MKIGILSDSHGNIRLMTQAAELLTRQFGAEHLIHLGDTWEDQQFLVGCGVPVSGVPGLWCDAYQNPRIPNVRMDIFSGVLVVCAHCDSEVHPLPADTGLLCTGHTHHAWIRAHEGIPWLNPGHLAGRVHQNQPASVGLATIHEEEIDLAILEVNGDLRVPRTFPRRDRHEGAR